MLVLSKGQQGYNLSPRISDEPADEWHITANAPYSGVGWEMRWRGKVCADLHHVSFLSPVFLAVLVDSKEEPLFVFF